MASGVALELLARPAAFAALQTLDAEGLLKFELLTVVEELLALFCQSESLKTEHALVLALYQACLSNRATSRECQSATRDIILSVGSSISPLCSGPGRDLPGPSLRARAAPAAGESGPDPFDGARRRQHPVQPCLHRLLLGHRHSRSTRFFFAEAPSFWLRALTLRPREQVVELASLYGRSSMCDVEDFSGCDELAAVGAQASRKRSTDSCSGQGAAQRSTLSALVKCALHPSCGTTPMLTVLLRK